MIEHVHTMPVVDRWVTHLTFSPWTLIEPGSCKIKRLLGIGIMTEKFPSGEALVAYGTADGAIGLIKVKQSLKAEESASPFGPRYHTDASFEYGADMVCRPDKAGITALEWVEVRGKKASRNATT